MTERDEGRHGLPPRRKKTARFPAAVRNDEFLYHLHRGSSLLLEGDVHGAKVELENALAFQPQDAKSQDLLAGVYFRLGLYPRAIEIWEELVDAYPHEPTLRVNLGLAYFKTRQTAAAREQLREALRDQPAHPRAWGYLGLAEWRLGHLSAARDAFRRGGHTGMAERMEAALVGAASAPPEELPPELAAKEPEAAAVPRAPQAPEPAGKPLEAPMAAAPDETAEPAPAGSRASLGEAATEELTRSALELPAAATGVPRPPTLETRLAEARLVPPPGVPMALTPAGLLLVSSETNVSMRYANLCALRGELRLRPLPRRRGGVEIDERLGENDTIMRFAGPIQAVVEPREGQRYEVLELAGGSLYVREEALFGFAGDLRYESAMLNLDGAPAPLVQLQGEGCVVLSLRGELWALPVGPDGATMVEPTRVVGWTGRLFPGARPGTAPYDAAAPRLCFRGEGIVMVGVPGESK